MKNKYLFNSYGRIGKLQMDDSANTMMSISITTIKINGFYLSFFFFVQQQIILSTQ